MASLAAFNRWLDDEWGYDRDGRIFAAPVVSFADPDAAVQEVERLIERGARIVHVRPAPVPAANGTSRSLGDTRHDPVWGRLAEAGVAVGFHLGDSGYNTFAAGEPPNRRPENRIGVLDVVAGRSGGAVPVLPVSRRSPMTTRWGLARRLAVVIALAVAVVGRPTGAEGASGDAAVPSVPGPCLVDRPCLLSAGLPAADVLNPRLAPDGNRVVFVHEEAGSSDLYSVAITGTPSPRKLDAPAANVGIKNVFISPDSSRVIYTAQAEPGGPRTLYSVPITGSPSDNVRLASNVGGVPRISPNGRIVVVAFDTMDRLRAVPIEGPANAGGRLTDPFVAGGAIVEFKIANDGSVVYLADQDTNGVEELYRVPLTLAPAPDPPTTKLNGPLAPGGEVSAFSLELNNTPVAYLADQDTNDVTELYSVRLGGGGRTKLNRPLPAGWDVRSVLVDEAGWIPDDGTRIVYETGGPSGDQLHSALLAGPATTSVRLDQPPAPGTRVFSFRVSADGGRVVYTLRGATGGGEPLYFLFSVPTAGPASASVLLNWPSAEYGFGVISPDGSRVVNRLRGALDNSAIEGGTIVRINGSEPPDWPFLIDATSTRAFYLSRNGTEADLYSAPMSGSGARYNLTQTLDAEVDYRHVELTSGPSQRLVFVAHRSDGDHLYWSRLVPGIVPPPLP